METIKEIAKTLRSTEKMAAAFVQSVRDKIGQDIPEDTILTVMQKLSPRSIGISKVVTLVKREMTKEKRSAARQSRNTKIIPIQATGKTQISKKRTSKKSKAKSQNQSTSSRPVIEQVEDVLAANWRRAEKDGLKPARLSGPAFIQATHRHCDPRDATKARVLRACKQIDSKDIVVTPTAVADVIRAET